MGVTGTWEREREGESDAGIDTHREREGEQRVCAAFTTTTIQILLDYKKFMWQSICKKKHTLPSKGRQTETESV